MKKTTGMVLLVGSALAFFAGCSNVTSGMHSNTGATGEGWYSKDTGIGMLIFSSSIYHCPKDTPDKCVKAEYVEGEQGPAIPK